MKTSLIYERRLWRQGYIRVAGVDEVGRGAWAGPLVAVAVLMDKRMVLKRDWWSLVQDSKKLSPERRENVYRAAIKEVRWAMATVNNKEIDKLGVAAANIKVINKAVVNLKKTQCVLADFVFNLGKSIAGKPAKVIIKGDAQVFSIALASILAKVERDRMMNFFDKKYPGYGFAANKGYGTRQHAAAIKRLGPCALHRRSYRPIKALPAILKNVCPVQQLR